MNKPIYGHLAILKLVQIAGYDDCLGGSAKRVLAILSGYADGESYTAYPSITKIAKALCLSRQAVTKQIAILEKQGYLTRTSNFKPSGGRSTNIITFNVELVHLYSSQPDIFCRKNVTLIVTYLVTLLSYGGMEPYDLMALVTPESCIKKPSKENIIKKQKKEKTIKKARVQANAWWVSIVHDEKLGISKEDRLNIDILDNKLREYMNSYQMCDFSIKVNKETKKFPLKERMKKTINMYKDKVAAFQ